MVVGFRGGQVKHRGSKNRLDFLISPFIFITVEEEGGLSVADCGMKEGRFGHSYKYINKYILS